MPRPEFTVDHAELRAFWGSEDKISSTDQEMAEISSSRPDRHAEDGQDAPHYTVFVRLPFPRGDFEDPPLVDWNADKDRALWGILSRNPRGSDLNWKELASQFDVTVPFILQQAAWLYERQLSQVRAQMMRVNKDASPSNSPLDTDPTPVAGTANDGAGSSQMPGEGRVLPVRTSEDKLGSAGTAAPLAAPPPTGSQPMSRTPSGNVASSSRQAAKTPAGQHAALATPRSAEAIRQSANLTAGAGPTERSVSPSIVSSSSSSSSSASASEDNDDIKAKRPKPFKRPTRFGGARNALYRSAQSRPTLGSDASEQEGTPFAFHRPSDDLAETVKGQNDKEVEAHEVPEMQRVESALSPASSDPSIAAPVTQRGPSPTGGAGKKSVARHGAFAGRGGPGRNASDGTPSMGSSFSDLDDASVTQSALEEALLSNMQRGGGGSMASRLGSISQAVTRPGEQRAKKG